jgi:hypothetical protein
VIPGDGRFEHIVCVPGVTTEQIDDLVDDIRQVAGVAPAASATPAMSGSGR